MPYSCGFARSRRQPSRSLLSRLKFGYRYLYSRFQRREVAWDHSPKADYVDRWILVSQSISQAPNVAPRNCRAEGDRQISQLCTGFTDDEQRMLNGENGLLILAERLSTETSSEPFDAVDII
jgi:hypothetical protein